MTGSVVVVRGELDGSLLARVTEVIDSIDISETSRRQYKREVLPFLEWLGPNQLHPNILLGALSGLIATKALGSQVVPVLGTTGCTSTSARYQAVSGGAKYCSASGS
jgi:hypothetical protein